MSATLSLAITAEEGGQFSYNSVDEPRHVVAGWRTAKRNHELLHIRRVWFKAVPESEGECVHAGSPREIMKIEDAWINPDWIDAVTPGHYPEVAAEWRAKHDQAASS